MWKMKILVALVVLLSETKEIFSRPNDDVQEPQWLLQLKLGMFNKNSTIKTSDPRPAVCPSRRNGSSLQETFTRIKKESTLDLVQIDGGSYHFERERKLNYFEAMQFCLRHGKELVSMETEDENRNIINFIQAHATIIDHFWTSGNDLSAEGHFTWFSTGQPFAYTNWRTSLPDNYDNEDCLEIRDFGGDNYSWNDMPCMQALNFICEVKKCTDFCMG